MQKTLKIKLLHPNANMPSYAHDGDAAFDLYTPEVVELKPGERKSVSLGISMEIPDGHVGLIWDKSGLSHKHGLKTFGGVVDSGYRGEVHVGIWNISNNPYTFEKGHKIAQMIIQKREHVRFKQVAELSDSTRGGKGFGSSGK